MKLIIAGGRTFQNTTLLQETVYRVYTDMRTGQLPITEIVCGMAKGADSLGQLFAESHGIPVKEFPADWAQEGRAAGILRNRVMGNYADELLAFWDGKSRGTAHMIEFMTQLKKPVWVRTYTP